MLYQEMTMPTVDPYVQTRFQSAYLAPSYACNNNCIWCYADYYRREQRMPTLALGAARKLIRLFQALGVKRVNLLGGEPTVYPHCLELIKEIADLGMQAILVTNGRALARPEFVAQLEAAGVSTVSISVQSEDADTHARIVGDAGAFTETWQGIRNGLRASFRLQTTTVIGGAEEAAYRGLIDRLIDVGARNLVMNSCLPVLKGPEADAKLLRPALQARLLEKLYLHARDRGVKMHLLYRLPLCLLSPTTRTELLSEHLVVNGCNVYTGDSFAVNPDGSVLPCSHWMGYPIARLFRWWRPQETISREKFLRIWNRRLPFRLRRSVWKYRSRRCIGCPHWGNACFAGCILFWKDLDPTKEIPGLPENERTRPALG
jgi:radical SAM protein with 4Fe4S-binding SPASM domain